MKLLTLTGSMALLAGIGVAGNMPARMQDKPTTDSGSPCRVEATVFDGWQAQQITNRWLKLVFVPQLGGRLMQVTFAGHPFLFVNPKYSGQSFPASETTREWFNYGGDKIWPMPEGSQDDQHWPGPISDPLDDGNYAFHDVSQGSECTVRMEGPPDTRTGLQYTREVSVGPDSPQISFRATMKNASTHPIRWSVQTVTQYDTADALNPAAYNHDFWAFTPANPQSAYLDGYHVRSGLADDPSYSVNHDLFSLHWLYLQSEVWIDSPANWIAVVDGSSQFAMVEQFKFDAAAEYPGKADVIFYKNGPGVEIDHEGNAVIRTSADDTPFYMEAELNSPMVKLAAGESYTFKTEWFPTRAGSDFKIATDAGVVNGALAISDENNRTKLTGAFGVFFAGQLVAQFSDEHDGLIATIPLQSVDPSEEVKLSREIKVPVKAAKVSLHVIDQHGVDRGSLGEVRVPHAAGGD
jgi:hypothetical protein